MKQYNDKSVEASDIFLILFILFIIGWIYYLYNLEITCEQKGGVYMYREMLCMKKDYFITQ